MSDLEVLIPHHAGPERIAGVLGALAAQTLGHDVCVIDNAAPARSREIAEQAGARVLAMGENSGFGRAINAAARSSAADRVVLLNDDCVPAADFLARIGATADRTGAAAIAGVLLKAAGPVDSAGVEVDQSLHPYDYMHGQRYDAGSPPARGPLGPTGGAALYDRETFLALGGFDERFFAYFEDVDLALRMALAGHACELAWDATAIHEHSGTLGAGSAAKNRLIGESRGLLLAKWRRALGRRERVRGALIDLAGYAGRAVIDRDLAAPRGRLAARRRHGPPAEARSLDGVGLARIGPREALRRRLARRRVDPAPDPGSEA